MRPVSVFANGPGSEIEQLRGRPARPVAAGHPGGDGAAVAARLTAAQIAELLDCHPATVRRWISRFNAEGLAGLADRPRSGRPRLGGRRLTSRIAALLARPGPVDPAADPAVPGLAAGQPADAVPAGPAGGDLAAAEADRPRRPGP